jgi:hypothetical protein
MTGWKLLALAALAAALPGTAGAQCRPDIKDGRILAASEYDPFHPAATEIPIEVRIHNAGNSACSLRMTVTGNPGLRFLRGWREVRYEVTTPGGQIIRNEDASAYGVPVSIAANTQTLVPLLIRVAPGQLVQGGPYHDLLELQLHLGAGSPVGKEVSLPATIDVDTRAQINISGTDTVFGGGPALQTIDFGDLYPGSERRAFLQLRANSLARVTISSLNRGMLVNAALGADAKIPYKLTIDGQSVDLARGDAELARRPPLTIDGVNYEMIAQIQNFTDKFAGIYRDVISMTVSPAE